MVDLLDIHVVLDRPTPLFGGDEHAIYWLGISEETAFRCNAYLIRDGDQAILVDPGSRAFFGQVRDRVAQIVEPSAITGMVLCHQDPDVAASMVDWLEVNPDIRVITTPRAHILLPYYGRGDYRFHDVTEKPCWRLPSGAELRFIEAPFLHFPGAFTSYDSASRYLFSGDLWAALSLDWSLTVTSFEAHRAALDLFHQEYMASNVAARGYINRLSGLPIDAILPQHGSIIGPRHVPEALHYFEELQCGTDLIYPDL